MTRRDLPAGTERRRCPVGSLLERRAPLEGPESFLDRDTSTASRRAHPQSKKSPLGPRRAGKLSRMASRGGRPLRRAARSWRALPRHSAATRARLLRDCNGTRLRQRRQGEARAGERREPGGKPRVSARSPRRHFAHLLRSHPSLACDRGPGEASGKVCSRACRLLSPALFPHFFLQPLAVILEAKVSRRSDAAP